MAVMSIFSFVMTSAARRAFFRRHRHGLNHGNSPATANRLLRFAVADDVRLGRPPDQSMAQQKAFSSRLVTYPMLWVRQFVVCSRERGHVLRDDANLEVSPQFACLGR